MAGMSEPRIDQPSQSGQPGQPSPSTSARAPKSAVDQAVKAARGSAQRYRIMAWVTGTMLLALCVEMILKYLLHVDVGLLKWIPIAHGWIYVIYLVTVVDLWSKMRWNFKRLTTMVLAGVVPVMSFILERTVYADAQAKIAAAASILEQ